MINLPFNVTLCPAKCTLHYAIKANPMLADAW